MRITVEVGGWEHECCGPTVERDDVVTFDCNSHMDSEGQVRLIESHHDLKTSRRVHGRVVDVRVVEPAGTSRPVLRLPSGRALRGCDPEDDGHLEDPWTGEVVAAGSTDFPVVIQTR
ncbi:DUF6578 domain-containing protein [Kineococcus sp. SYSU DK002]|uniref:DUF6578 domain-containing protein n=1 Tax=Kineococcus sp. SYSU DK002 TaxID=3383123 RepID=UPI003D7E8524